MGAEPPVLRCRGLTRIFGSGHTARPAVDRVDAAVPPGARIALTGPSGSGKTTLLHLFAGLDAPTSGAIEWPGLSADPHRDRTRIGVVFQAPSLLETLDVTENVEIALLLAGTPADRARSRAQATLHRLELDALGRRLPDELSGGQLHRVALARVLAGSAEMLLVDEATGQLDHRTGSRVLDALFETADRSGAALILSTHDPVVANRCPVIWSMRAGRLDTARVPP